MLFVLLVFQMLPLKERRQGSDEVLRSTNKADTFSLIFNSNRWIKNERSAPDNAQTTAQMLLMEIKLDWS